MRDLEKSFKRGCIRDYSGFCECADFPHSGRTDWQDCKGFASEIISSGKGPFAPLKTNKDLDIKANE